MRYLLVFILLSFTLKGQNFYYPADVWVEKTPESQGLNSKKLLNAIEFAISNENSVEKDLRIAILKSFGNEPGYKIKGPTKNRGGANGLIIKNGYIVGRWGDTDRVDMTFSVTKSYLSKLLALLTIKNLSGHDKLKDYIWDGKFDDPHNSQITWHHLLNQSSRVWRIIWNL